MRRAAVALLALALVASAPGCGEKTPEARTVTSDEADRLAVARFLNYQDGGRAVDVVVPSSSGQQITVSASVDFTEHLGYGVLRTKGSDAPGSQGLLQWTPKVLVLLPGAPPAEPPATPPRDGWKGRKLQAKGATLDTTLALVFNLASDRPENAQLLKQNGARWLGAAKVDGRKTDVFEGPKGKGASTSRLKYYLDSSGKMAKVEAKLGTADKPVVITFPPRKYTKVELVPGVPKP